MVELIIYHADLDNKSLSEFKYNPNLSLMHVISLCMLCLTFQKWKFIEFFPDKSSENSIYVAKVCTIGLTITWRDISLFRLYALQIIQFSASNEDKMKIEYKLANQPYSKMITRVYII